MIVGIDASNLRGGGGVTHLTELLRAAKPADQGIRQVIVWSGQATLGQLPDRPWLHPVHDPLLDRSLLSRMWWQQNVLPRLAAHTDVIFSPGTTPVQIKQPIVVLFQNMLPFAPVERRRYGWSRMRLQLSILGNTQTWALRQAEGVIFLTEFARSSVEQCIGDLGNRQICIPHGIADEFRLAPRPAHLVEFYSVERPFRIVYVSIVTVYKHQWHVAEAIAQLREAGFPVVLDLVGPAYGPALRRLREVLQRVDPGQEFIHYVGPVDYGQLPTWYHQADAFVYASSCENLPIILLEAMAAGLPIACSNRGPMPGVLGQAGPYFDPENVNEIAAALQTLLTDHELRWQCAQMAFEQSQAYTWERCAKETFEFIVDIANRAPARLSDMGKGARSTKGLS